ncbi:MAG: response regulator transcription factor [Verrucomicrobia bacterium]|nr:MAG: response regulator transcription factor [Verrucomicrobiota bacterium]
MTIRKILLVDDHPLMTEGLRQLLDSQAGLSICGIASSAQQAIALVESTAPDLVITDLTLPGRNGLELIKDLSSTHPELPIIVLSMHDELLYAERVLRAGGRGFVTKNSPTERIIEAINCVLGGGVFASAAVTKHLLQAMLPGKSSAKPCFPLERLTDREIEVFELIGHAKGNHDISSQLGISPRTVDVHRAHIREKLGLEDGSALTRHAIRWVEVGMINS